MMDTNSLHLSDFGCLLLCDVCESEITLPDDLTDTGCCAACGVTYVFDLLDQRPSATA